MARQSNYWKEALARNKAYEKIEKEAVKTILKITDLLKLRLKDFFLVKHRGRYMITAKTANLIKVFRRHKKRWETKRNATAFEFRGWSDARWIFCM